ncbi:MAG: DUF2336 domain-containing protein [Pseudomonadota bacterium]
MRVELTRADIHELMENPSEETRAEIAEKVARNVAAGNLSENERHIADQILGMMVEDTAVRVREALSLSLKDSDDIPRSLAINLARDIERVANPMLANSPVFTPDDLIHFVRVGTAQKQIAVAGRQNLEGDVSDALVEAGNSTVVAALFRNETASIAPQTMERAFSRFGAFEEVHEPMASRTDLPLAVAEKLVTLVADHIRTALIDRHGASVGTIVEDLTVRSREKLIAELALGCVDHEEIHRLVQHLHRSGSLTHSLILRSAILGNLRFMEEAFAVLAGVEHTKAWVLVHDRGTLGLKALYSETGLPPRLYPAFRVAVDVFNAMEYDEGPLDRERFAERSMERILTQYHSLEADDLEFFLNRLQELAQGPATADEAFARAEGVGESEAAAIAPHVAAQ